MNHEEKRLLELETRMAETKDADEFWRLSADRDRLLTTVQRRQLKPVTERR